jgi:hypothetical protein
MEGSSNPFLCSEPFILVSPRADRLGVKDRHSEHRAAAPGTRPSTFFIGRRSDKLPRDLMAMDRKHCGLVTGLLTDDCTLRWHLHIMDLWERAKCRKCGQKE